MTENSIEVFAKISLFKEFLNFVVSLERVLRKFVDWKKKRRVFHNTKQICSESQINNDNQLDGELENFSIFFSRKNRELWILLNTPLKNEIKVLFFGKN